MATLGGKMEKYALIRSGEEEPELPEVDFSGQVLDVLVVQLGHKPGDAKKMVAQALKLNPAIASPEELFDEVYRGEKKKW